MNEDEIGSRLNRSAQLKIEHDSDPLQTYTKVLHWIK